MCAVCVGQAHEAKAYAKARVCTHYSRRRASCCISCCCRILWSRLDKRITGQLSFCTNADTGHRCMCCTAGQRHANKAYAGYPLRLYPSRSPAARPTQLLISLASVSRNRPALAAAALPSIGSHSAQCDNCRLTAFLFVRFQPCSSTRFGSSSDLLYQILFSCT